MAAGDMTVGRAGSKNGNLGAAKVAKNDEFYTQYEDIEKEMNAYLEYNEDVFRGKTVLLPCDDPEWSNFTKYFAQNFERFGLKKLISTSYAVESKRIGFDWEPTLFESEDPNFDLDKTKTHGKIFILDSDTNGNGRVDIDDLKWDYLEGDGDFRSEEVKRLRDEADIIATNPPFSLFRQFLKWILEADKKFLVIGNMNAISFKEVFPLLKENAIWLGPSITSGDREFRIPSWYESDSKAIHYDAAGNKYTRVPGVRWFTNLDHGRRHQPLQLMSMSDNVKYSRHKEVRGMGYLRYENYDAIEIPFTDAIPSDYDGPMGVPISFMDKYCPEQFEIVGQSLELADMSVIRQALGKLNGGPRLYVRRDGVLTRMYERIIIRKKR